MCQISSFMAAAEGPVAEFSGFANFDQKKRKSNLSMSFPKIVNQMGSFGQKRKNIFFRFCRPILDIFGFTLLTTPYHLMLQSWYQNTAQPLVNTLLPFSGHNRLPWQQYNLLKTP